MMDHPTEEWKPIPGLDGYEASSLGRVRSWWNRRRFPATEPHIVGNLNQQGYYVLRTHRRGPERKVHRLVCEAFNGPAPEGKSVCRHLNDVRTDNRPENLAWGTPGDNVQDALRNGSYEGKMLGARKLTPEQVAEIRRVRAETGETHASLARRYDVCEATIQHLLKGRTWRMAL